ncbi:MAG: hypothetical protein IH607_06225 [Firmicutes bacterium]|nr:hypothetical protein [Bacillota bacterium]
MVLFLLPDVRWVADGQRLNGDQERRKMLSDRLLGMYREFCFGEKMVILSGSYEERLTRAIKLVDALLLGNTI